MTHTFKYTCLSLAVLGLHVALPASSEAQVPFTVQAQVGGNNFLYSQGYSGPSLYNYGGYYSPYVFPSVPYPAYRYSSYPWYSNYYGPGYFTNSNYYNRFYSPGYNYSYYPRHWR